jgi:hypothetical protein
MRHQDFLPGGRDKYKEGEDVKTENRSPDPRATVRRVVEGYGCAD